MHVHRSPVASRALLALTVTMAACSSGGGGGGNPGTPPPPPPPADTVALALSFTSLTVPAGSVTNVVAAVARKGGYAGTVTITPAAPAGVAVDSATLRPRASSVALRIRVDAAQAAGTALDVPITASAGAGTSTALLSITVAPQAPSSQALIQADLDAGSIDYPTSLLYRAYALFGDARLPARYQGAGSLDEDLLLSIEIDQATLPDPSLFTPFAVRPTDPASFFNRPTGLTAAQGKRMAALGGARPLAAADCPAGSGATATQWRSAASAANPLRVWIQCSSDAASDDDTLSAVVEIADQVYQEETGYMGPPKADAGGDANGGDTRIDIYLADLTQSVQRGGQTYQIPSNAVAATWIAPPKTNGTSSGFMLVNPATLGTGSFDSSVVHEFFHVLQFAYNATVSFEGGNEWWYVEASAKWAETKWASATDGQEVHYLFSDWRNGSDSLHKSVPGAVARDTGTEYMSYIWPFFAEHVLGAGTVQASWNAVIGATAHDQANHRLDQVFDFKSNFREFAYRNANGVEVDDAKRYHAWDDQFPDLAPPAGTQVIHGTVDAGQTYHDTATVKALRAFYFWYYFTQATKPVHLVTVDVSGVQAAADADFDSLEKHADGSGWKRVDRRGQTKWQYCFDKPDKKLDVLAVVLANHQLDLNVPVSGEVVLDTQGACDSWSGTATADAPGGYTITASVTYDLDPAALPGAPPTYLPRGTVTYAVPNPDASGCTTTVSPSTHDVVPQEGLLRIDFSTTPPTYGISGTTVWPATYTKTCPDGSTGSVEAGAGGTWVFDLSVPMQPDGTIKGNVSVAGGALTYTYSFTRTLVQ
jgi:hypothetical protein